MTDSFLLNDGTSFITLNSGGHLLMNEHIDEIKIHGVHATQRTTQKRRTKLIPVEFTFWLIAGILKTVEMKLLNFGHLLAPHGFYTNSLRKTFKLEVTELLARLKILSKQSLKEALQETAEAIISEQLDDPLWRFQYLLDKIRRKNGKRK